jgi:hypothetical protein
MKQAPRVFHETLSKSLIEIGFRSTHTDVSVFVKVIEGGIMILTIYVDDILIFGRQMRDVDEVKRQLKARFEIDDRGDVNFFLGIHVTRDRQKREIKISQTAYAAKTVEKFAMGQSQCRSGTPLPQGFVMSSCLQPTVHLQMMKRVR